MDRDWPRDMSSSMSSTGCCICIGICICTCGVLLLLLLLLSFLLEHIILELEELDADSSLDNINPSRLFLYRHFVPYSMDRGDVDLVECHIGKIKNIQIQKTKSRPLDFKIKKKLILFPSNLYFYCYYCITYRISSWVSSLLKRFCIYLKSFQ